MNIDFRVYLITDRKQVKPDDSFKSLLSAVREAIKGGVRAVQLREKDLNTREILSLSYKMKDITRRYNAKLFINDRFDIALATGADGVHLTQNSIPVEAVRSVVKDKLLIGVSTHSLKEAREAERGGADFITFGPVFRTPSKIKYGPPVGLDELERICRSMSIPVFALGGIKAGRVKKVLKAGASGVSMISEIISSDNIKTKAEKINLMFN